MIQNSSKILDSVINGEINVSKNFSGMNYREIFTEAIVALFDDQEITEIMFNAGDVHIEKNGKLSKQDFHVEENVLQRFVEHLSQYNNKNVDYNHPIFDGKMPDGSRCNIVIAPVSLKGTCITIRKHNKNMHSMDRLMEQKMLSSVQKEILAGAIRNRENIIVSGGTGSGKTTLVNALLNSGRRIDSERIDNERIITIEDTAELSINLPHVVSLESKFPTPDCPIEITIRDLVKTALRMRPDRIIIGEIRGCEAYDLLHALNTGHNGMLCTMHSNSCRDALRRLETLAILGHNNLDISIPRHWIAGNIDVVVHLEKQDGLRKLLEIKRIEGIECSNYVLADIV